MGTQQRPWGSATGRAVRCFWGGLGLALAVGFCGCGERETWVAQVADPAYPVKGKVLLPGGKPLPSGRVEFYPVTEPGLLAHGEIQADGTFELQTRQAGDGAVPGEYKVRILIPETREYRRLANYRDEDGSKLTATVKAEPNSLSAFQLK